MKITKRQLVEIINDIVNEHDDDVKPTTKQTNITQKPEKTQSVGRQRTKSMSGSQFKTTLLRWLNGSNVEGLPPFKELSNIGNAAVGTVFTSLSTAIQSAIQHDSGIASKHRQVQAYTKSRMDLK